MAPEPLAAEEAPGYAKQMADERAMQAIERIERALGRIEAAARSAPAAPGGDEELRALRDVHQALQEKVGGAIAQIDRLLAARND